MKKLWRSREREERKKKNLITKNNLVRGHSFMGSVKSSKIWTPSLHKDPILAWVYHALGILYPPGNLWPIIFFFANAQNI